MAAGLIVVAAPGAVAALREHAGFATALAVTIAVTSSTPVEWYRRFAATEKEQKGN